MQATFRGRKNYPTQNVLAAVHFDLKFTYVLAGWEGSYLNQKMNNNRTDACLYILVLGKFYLVDARYACCPEFLPPYRGTRYHLNEYAGRHYPTNGRELFNLRHSSLRVTIERAFGH